MATGALKHHFRELQRGRPGHRFQDHYAHERRARRGGSNPGRTWRLVLGVLAIVIGLVLCVIPGPGLPFIFLGGGLLAAESLVAARIMDWLELRVRAVWHWARERWARLPLWGKIIVAALVVAGGAAGLLLFWRLLH
jgi:uncharacterized protein (TIGR02611 family)